MRLKNYQDKALEVLYGYLDGLRGEFEKDAKVAAALAAAGLPPQPLAQSFDERAWRNACSSGLVGLGVRNDGGAHVAPAYQSRTAGSGQPIPNVCLKVPTGGGKTLLAVWGAGEILRRFCKQERGLVLWIVPNEAIYSQTKRQLTNRDHPYRQALDRFAAGADRVKILEKDDPLHAADVKDHLCVMLLMLQSANRVTQAQLRLFRDRGNVHGFFPPEGDAQAHFDLLGQVRNLDVYGDRRNMGALIKDSLGNVLRLVRPVVVLDEGHKAYSAMARNTLNDFNPAFILELSATPPAGANKLVVVTGQDLDREEMIKLPINVEVRAGWDWRTCLRAAWDRVVGLQAAADRLLADGGPYLRPLLLIQVERTGKEQRDPGFVHALDAKEYLCNLGLADDEIAIKTADVNELKGMAKDELQAPTCRIRAIITKQALQEGWDCPFAYVLCSLSSMRSLNAMTQLVGRILRQPEAVKTKVPALDECYVYCQHGNTADVVQAIRTGLEEDGMGDLAGHIAASGDGHNRRPAPDPKRRPEINLSVGYLPKVLWVEDGKVRELEYERDILQHLDWSTANVAEAGRRLATAIPREADTTIRLTLGSVLDPAQEPRRVESDVERGFDVAYAARATADIVGNPWLAYALAQQFADAARADPATKAALERAPIAALTELQCALAKEQDRLAEAHFAQKVRAGIVQFRLRTAAHSWKIPDSMPTSATEGDLHFLLGLNGRPTQTNLFEPQYICDFNQFEQEVAVYLDAHAATEWWFRNVARQAYGLQGWRKHRVYPDFVFALRAKGTERKVVALETKGNHLDNADTAYKRKLCDLLTDDFKRGVGQTVGALEIVVDQSTTVVCDLVFSEGWKNELTARHLI